MGGVGKALFGSPSKEKSESGNHAYDDISSAFKPALGSVGDATNWASSVLSQGPGGWADSGGFDFLMNQGLNKVNSNFYSRGLGESGAAMKGLENYRSGLASTYLNQYMDNVFKLGNLGTQAGNVLSGAGQFSKGSGTGAKSGIASQLASGVTSAIMASDRRLKENIVPIIARADGTWLYKFNYKQDTELNLPKGTFIGSMADELPASALGEPIKGYLTVKEEHAPRKIY